MEVIAMLIIVLLYLLILMGMTCVFLGHYVAMGQLFVKAGDKAWKAIIPCYNDYTMFKLTWKKRWFWIYYALAVLFSVSLTYEYIYSIIGLSDSLMMNGGYHYETEILIGLIATAVFGIAAIVVYCAYMYHIAKAFSEEAVGMTFGLVFLTSIFYMILGFGKSEYKLNTVSKAEVVDKIYEAVPEEVETVTENE